MTLRRLLLCIIAAAVADRCALADAPEAWLEVMIPESTQQLIASLESVSGTETALYDPDYGETDEQAEAKAVGWGSALGIEHGIVIPTSECLYYGVSESGEVMIPGTQNPDPFVDTSPSDNQLWGPRRGTSIEETLLNLRTVVLHLSEGSDVFKRSDGTSGFNMVAALGRIAELLAEDSAPSAFVSADALSDRIQEKADNNVRIVSTIAEIAEEKNITFYHLIVHPKSIQNTYSIGIDEQALVSVIVEEYVKPEFLTNLGQSGLPEQLISAPPTTLLDLASMFFPTLKPFAAVMSVLTFDSVPRLSPDAYVSAGKSLGNLLERGVVGSLVVDLSASGERLANELIGIPLVGTNPPTAGAAGSALIAACIPPESVAGSVVGLSSDFMRRIGDTDLGLLYRDIVQGEIEFTDRGQPLGALPLLLPAPVGEVQQPSRTIASPVLVAPAISPIGKQTFRTGSQLRVMIEAHDSADDMIRVSLGSDSPGILEGFVSVPGSCMAEYVYTCLTGCPSSFDVLVIATDGILISRGSFHVVRLDQAPCVVSDGDCRSRASIAISDTCASIGPLCFTMEPDWYEAGCLQFRDLDGDPLTFRLTQMPRFGTVNLQAAGSRGNYSVTVMYKIDREKMLACHRARTNLVDQITVQATDPYGDFAEAQMNFDFEVVNTPPTCVDDAATTPAGVPVTIDVLANDSDVDGDPLSVVEVGTPAGGGACVVDDEIVYTPDPNVCGTDTFSYTADDDYGGQATAWVSVDVIDNVPPVAVCQPATVYLGPDGTAVLDLEALDGGSTDNCGIVGYDASEKLFDCGDLGDCPVLFTVYDGAGHSDSCWTTVTVVDEIDPVAVGQDLTAFLDDAGAVTVSATQIENGSTDNCAVTEILIEGTSEMTFDCGDLGVHSVAFTVRDASGNEHSVDIVLTVADVIPPVARCQDLIVSLDATGQVTVSADAVDAGSTDNCGIASQTLDRDTFFETDIGDQTVTLTVTDTSGNADTCTATITVQDDMAPSLTCPPDKTVSVDAGTCSATDVDLGTPTATDNTQVDWSTLEDDAPDEFPVGDTSVRWSVADLYGNVGHCEQRVTVTEAVDPTVSCPGDMTVYTHDEDGETVTFSATATDTCDPDPQVTCVPSSGSTFPIGNTLVTCTATDNSGNTDTCTFTITVIYQNDPPVAADDEDEVPEGGGCIDIDVLANDTDPDGDELTVTQAGTPTCGTTEVINDGHAVRYCTEGCSDPPDTVTFTYTITDGHGSTDTATVTVDMPEGGIIFFTPPPPED